MKKTPRLRTDELQPRSACRDAAIGVRTQSWEPHLGSSVIKGSVKVPGTVSVISGEKD